MCFCCYGNLSFHILIMGKVEIDICFYVTADILTKVVLKCFWSSPLPTIWILSNSLISIGCRGNRKAKYLACNIYSILAEYSLHSCTFRWALWPMGLWLCILVHLGTKSLIFKMFPAFVRTHLILIHLFSSAPWLIVWLIDWLTDWLFDWLMVTDW